MSSYEHNQQPQVPDYQPVHVEGGGGAGKDYVTPTPLPPPPAAVGPPVKDGYEASDQNDPPHETQSRGDGFLERMLCWPVLLLPLGYMLLSVLEEGGLHMYDI